MAWIKRNLFFVIGIGVALLLLAAAVVYDLQSWGHNSKAKDRLNEIYGQLQQEGNGKYLWGNNKVNNIQTAKEQVAQIDAWINKTTDYFQPIEQIPNAPVSSATFAVALRQTIDQLQHEATNASVELPPKYGFSFEAQRSTMKFAPGSLPQLALQLGEVKTISEIVFAAHVNSLDSVQRARVSDDDAAGPQADYVNDVSVTNNLAIMTPYAVTFRSFSGELATVLAGFAASPHGFVVKGINVAQAAQAGAGANPSPPVTAPPVVGRGGLPTVLKEKLLRITLEIEIVKLKR